MWYTTGRSFTRGGSFPAGVQGWWGAIGPTGYVWELSHFTKDGVAILYCPITDVTCTWAELLIVPGTLREVAEMPAG